MSDYREVFQQYLDMDSDERNAIASGCINNIMGYLEDIYDSDYAVDKVMDMFAVFCCVDGVVNRDEYSLFVEATGADVDYETFFNATSTGTYRSEIEKLYSFLSGQDQDFISEVFVLALCILASNGTLTVSEQEFLEEFFG